MAREGGADSRSRGQAETIGVILIFGLVLTGAVVVVAFGASAIGDTQDRVSEDRAEKAMTQFDSKAALVALGNSDTQEVNFGTDRQSDYEVSEDKGWMRITIENQSGTGGSTTLVNESLGTVIYEVNDKTIAYQGGGVWKRVQANESRMVSPPEFYFRDGTLTLPIVNVTGASSLGSTASVTHQETVQTYPSVGDENPLENRLVKVTVQSQYYKGWGRYFEERTDGEVQYDHGRNIVTLTLLSPAGSVFVTEGLSAYAAGNLTISGNPATTCGPPGGRDIYIDSYNSSMGEYCSQTPGSAGNISYKGTVDINGMGIAGPAIDVNGTVKSEEWVNFSNSNWDVSGDVVYSSDCEVGGGGNCTNVANGDVIQSDDSILTERSALDLTIERVKADSFQQTNDNTGAINISGGTLQSTSVTLTSGRYYLDHMRRENDVKFNVCGGDIEIFVDGDIELDETAPPDPVKFEVIEPCGDTNNQVLIYVNGSSANSNGDGFDFRMSSETDIIVPDGKASKFRLFGKKDFRAELGDGSNGPGGDPPEFTGVIFAPTGADQSADGEVLMKKAIVFGAVVTGDTELATGSSLHYDEELKKEQVLPPDTKVLKITYLHVSVNRVRVD